MYARQRKKMPTRCPRFTLTRTPSRLRFFPTTHVFHATLFHILHLWKRNFGCFLHKIWIYKSYRDLHTFPCASCKILYCIGLLHKVKKHILRNHHKQAKNISFSHCYSILCQSIITLTELLGACLWLQHSIIFYEKYFLSADFLRSVLLWTRNTSAENWG